MPRGSRTAAATYSPAWCVCRFCGQAAPQSRMAKYGTRHYAHAVCLYQRRGIEAIDALHTWQLRHLPIVALMGAGVTLDQVRAWQVRIATDDVERDARESTKTSAGDSAGEDE
jgi:hypothetical protein